MRALLVSLVAAVAALGQPAPKFPAATATWQDLLVAKPMARATLTAGVSDVATAIPVSDGAQYAAFSAVQIQEEVILICSVDANTLNVCPGGRGFSGTVAAAHGIGLAVRNTITTHHHNQLAAEVKAIQDTLGPNLSNVASSWENISGKPTTFLFSDQSYTDPAWLTITKGKVGLGSVENTALSTWAGSTAITTLGTLSAGTVPWARLGDVPGSFTPSAHSHAIGDLSTVGDWSSKITSGTYSINISGSAGSAGSVTNGVYTTGSYSDPAWLSLSKAKVGLGSVENTALSTWAGSGNITTLGTISSGTVPWARLSGVPGTFTPAAHSHAVGDLSTVGDYSSKITSGTYSINISGTAAAASGVAWGGVSGKPTTLGGYGITDALSNQSTSGVGIGVGGGAGPQLLGVGGGASALTFHRPGAFAANFGLDTDNQWKVGGWSMGTNVAYKVWHEGNDGSGSGLDADTLDGVQPGSLSVNYANSAGSANSVAWANVSGKGSGDGTRLSVAQLGCSSAYNSSCDPGGNGQIDYADSSGYATSAGSAPANGGNSDTVDGYHASNIANARTHDASWAWQDDYLALPLNTLQWGVFTPRAAQATITEIWCASDTNDATLVLRRNDGGDMNSAVTCNGSTSAVNGYGVLPVGYYVGMFLSGGTAKSVRVAIKYTVAY